MRKKILSLLLSAAVLLTLLPISAFAADEAVITVDSAEVQAGQSVTIPVRMTNYQAFTNFEFGVVYDKDTFDLTINTSYTVEAAGMTFKVNYWEAEAAAVNNNIIAVGNSTAIELGSDGTLFTITLTAKEGASNGVYPISLVGVYAGELIMNELPLVENSGVTVPVTYHSGSVTVTGGKAEEITGATVTTEQETYTYTGEAITPNITVTTADGKPLTEGTDYTVAYSDNTNAGTATITVTGTGNYSGTVTKNFTIDPAAQTLTVKESATVLNGKTLELSDLVEGAKGKLTFTLADGADAGFSLSESTLTAPAEAGKTAEIKVQAAATDNYAASVEYTIKVTSVDKTDVSDKITFADGTAVYNGGEQTLETATITGVSGGSWSYSYTTTDGTLSENGKPVGAGTYTVTAAYEDDGNAGSAAATFTINPKALTEGDFTVDVAAETYDGQAKTKTITSGLTEDTDYTVAYENNINVGTATITITGKGNYADSVTYSFTIGPKTLTESDFTVPDSAGTYDGTEKTVDITTDLTVDTDYTVAYENNTNAGTAKITITGKGNYTGSVEYSFTINPVNAAGAEVTLKADEYAYTGKAIEPAVTVAVEGKPLTEGTDYTVSYSDNTSVGTASVTVNFQGNYTGSVTKTFGITAAAPTVNVTTSVSSGTIRVTVTTFDGGSAITGYTVALKDGDETVETQEITEDGTVTFTGLTNGKTYTVEVTVTNDEGTVTETVTAIPKASSGGGSSGGSVTTTKPVTAEDAENGTVTVSPESAAPGASVTVTPTPDDGYTVDQVTVTDANGNSVEVTDNGDGTYSFVMPGTAVTVAATFKADEAEHDCPSEKFTDFVTGAWYHEAVDYVVVNGYFVGTTETTFEPETPMTRAMFVQVLANMSGADLSKYTSSSFTDVDTGAWYAPAVEWAYRSGIVNGVGDGLFAPGQEITREQMAKMLRDYASFIGANVSNTDKAGLNAFADSADVSDWAVEAVAWAVNNGIINGTDKGLEPLNNATRAEVAQILMNFDQKS